MNRDQIQAIADAVLYEGYLLYPYRHSAIKNRQRWTFGVVYPQAYSETQPVNAPWTMVTQCLVTGRATTTLDVTVRWLHLLTRSVSRATPAVPAAYHAETVEADDTNLAPVALHAAPGGATGAIGWAPDSWEEGMPRDVTIAGVTLSELLAAPRRGAFAFPAARLTEPSETALDETIVRDQRALAGAITLAAAPVAGVAGSFLLTVRIENTTPLDTTACERHDLALLSSFVSTHTILEAHDGAFVSLLDPPARLHAAANACQNEHTYPVLVGDMGAHDAMLSSPIILYDYPQIAPESVGSLFDGTEIDEILTLRILALTDEEKDEMRQGDERTREMLARTESITAEQLMKLHGVIRSLGPASAAGNEQASEGGGV